jgi:hypothetical protein
MAKETASATAVEKSIELQRATSTVDPAKQIQPNASGIALASKPGVVLSEKTRADGSKFTLRIRTH